MDQEQRRTVIVVEDSDELRDLLEHIFRSAGFSVIGCEDADSAFEAIRRERPDLVITDIGLGVTSGLDLITRIRSDLRPPLPPIIACSGFSDFKQQALDRGAYLFLPKPFEARSLLRAASDALAGKPASPAVAAQATEHARVLRQEAIAAADTAQAQPGTRPADVEARARWTAEWLPSYFGFGHTLLALIEGTELRVLASSDPKHSVGGALDESTPFCRDVVETSSNLVLADASRWAAAERQTARFFAGVPVVDGEVAIGASRFSTRLLTSSRRRISRYWSGLVASTRQHLVAP
jgi:CheY-like chemotaxis protein